MDTTNQFFETEAQRIFSFLSSENGMVENIWNDSPGISYIDFSSPRIIIRFGYEPFALPWCTILDAKSKEVRIKVLDSESDPAGNVLAQLPIGKEADQDLVEKHKMAVTNSLEAATMKIREWVVRNA